MKKSTIALIFGASLLILLIMLLSFSEYLELEIPRRRLNYLAMTGFAHRVGAALCLGAIDMTGGDENMNSLWLAAAREVPQILHKPDVMGLEIFVNKSVIKWKNPQLYPNEIAIIVVAPDPSKGNKMMEVLNFRMQGIVDDKEINWDQLVNINELGDRKTDQKTDRKTGPENGDRKTDRKTGRVQ